MSFKNGWLDDPESMYYVNRFNQELRRTIRSGLGLRIIINQPVERLKMNGDIKEAIRNNESGEMYGFATAHQTVLVARPKYDRTTKIRPIDKFLVSPATGGMVVLRGTMDSSWSAQKVSLGFIPAKYVIDFEAFEPKVRGNR